MTAIARLKDVLLGEDPKGVFACTYGFEPEFFEQEILPAMLPTLSVDRGAGNVASYLHAGDEALRLCPTMICCDRYESGKQLQYHLTPVDNGAFAFHPKLLLLDYGEVIRAVVSSANLTRSGWSTALELFLFEDLEPGSRHAWSAPLMKFLRGTQGMLPPVAAREMERYVSRVAEVKAGRPRRGQSRLASSFDGPLFEAVSSEVPKSNRVDVITPFLEGDEGAGVFDRIDEVLGPVAGTMYLRSEEADGAPIIRGPEAKLRRLFESGRWTVRRVRREWEGDEEDSPARPLHGKMLILRERDRAVVLMGSANVTSAALLRKPPRGNVELCALYETTVRSLSGILPQSDKVDLDDVKIVPPAEDEQDLETVADWVEEAVYHAETEELELHLLSDAPALQVSYQGHELPGRATPPVWRSKFSLGKELEIKLRGGGSEAIVPFLILNAHLMPPRGLSRKPKLEELLEIMAGAREPIDDGDLDSTDGAGTGVPAERSQLLREGQAFAWRKLLRGLAGLRRDLIRSAGVEIETKRLLDGPIGARGLMRALDELRGVDAFLDADYAFALHELRRAIGEARAESSKNTKGELPGTEDVQRWLNDLDQQLRKLKTDARGLLRKQLASLAVSAP